MKNKIKEILYFLPEIIIIILSILLAIFGFINMKISPPPIDLNKIEENVYKTYCIPILRLDTIDQQKEIKKAMMNSYNLMIISIFSAFILFFVSGWMMFNKFRHLTKIKVVNPVNLTVSQQIHSIT